MTVKIAISLPDNVFADMKCAAAEQGISRSALVLAALEKHFFDLETGRIRKQWASIPAEDFALSKGEQDELDWGLREAMKRMDEEDGGWPEFNG